VGETGETPEVEGKPMFRLNRKDLQLMAMIAEHKVLSLEQIALAHGRSKDAVGRRLNQIQQEGNLTSHTRGFGRGRGRPEKLVSVSSEGVRILRDKGMLPPGMSNEEVLFTESDKTDHLLLLNWLLVHLAVLRREVTFLSVNHVSSVLARATLDNDGLPLIHSQVRLPGTDKPVVFEPDAVFSIHHKESGKSLLFSLEVDRGTQDLANPDRSSGDIRQKILCYRQHFEQGGYKKYERLWSATFNGFRLLFLTDSYPRLVNLCKLVRDMPPCDFVWLSEQQELLQKGLHGPIWVRGGDENKPRQSIFGSQVGRVQEALGTLPFTARVG
jgi:hypothetical protein